MNTYSVTVTLTNGTTKTLTILAASPAAATLKAKFSKQIHTTPRTRIVQAEAILVNEYVPSPKVHTRALSLGN